MYENRHRGLADVAKLLLFDKIKNNTLQLKKNLMSDLSLIKLILQQG